MYTREQKKARLAEYAEHLIEEMLDWTEKAERPNLTEIEDEVLELRARFGVELARESIEAQEMRRPVPGPQCPQCGEEMDYKGQKEVRPHTWLGEVRYERGYYYCKPCKVGFFPSG